jgi:hypothetical protein
MPLNKPIASVEGHFIQINFFPRLKPRARFVPNGPLDSPLDIAVTEMDLAELPSLAGEGNRTLVSSLEGYSFTIKLHPR